MLSSVLKKFSAYIFSIVCPLFASHAHECCVYIQITIYQEKLLDIYIFFSTFADWPKEHDVELIQRIKAILPEGDQRSYENRTKHIPWENVSILCQCRIMIEFFSTESK